MGRQRKLLRDFPPVWVPLSYGLASQHLPGVRRVRLSCVTVGLRFSVSSSTRAPERSPTGASMGSHGDRHHGPQFVENEHSSCNREKDADHSSRLLLLPVRLRSDAAAAPSACDWPRPRLYPARERCRGHSRSARPGKVKVIACRSRRSSRRRYRP